MARNKFGRKVGRAWGRRVSKRPFGDARQIREEVLNEFRPFFDEETADLRQTYYVEPRQDIARSQSRGVEDIARSRQRLGQDISMGREQRDITEGQERQGFYQSQGASGVTSTSPTAMRLRDRLNRIQAARSLSQETGYTRAGQDVNRGEQRFNQDIARSKERLTGDEQRFNKMRRRALQQQVAGETYARSYQNN